MYYREFTSGPFLAVFAPPFLSGSSLKAGHYIRFYVAFFLYYLGLPLALLLHLFGTYHIRFYALDVVFLSFMYFSDKLRKAGHFILVCENPGNAWLEARNYIGMRAVARRPTASSGSVTISGGSFASYPSLLHCMFDLGLWFEHFESVRADISNAQDDKGISLPLFRIYEGRGNATPNAQSPKSCYEAVASGSKSFSDYPPLGSFGSATVLFFTCAGFGFLFWWWLLDPRGFERSTGIKLSRYTRSLRRLIRL